MVLRGRAREQEAITELLARVAGGSGGALLLYGERGLGKTALLAYSASVAGSRGFTVLTTTGVADEADLPHAGLHRLLQPVADPLPAPPPARAGGAALDLLCDAARTGPLLCCVDDADRLDPPSRDAIGYLARRLAGRPVALLATASAARVLAGIPALRLTALDDPDSRAIVADLLRDPLPGDIVAAVIALAGGNPQALVDLAGALTPAQRSGAAPPPTSLPPGGALRRAYQQELRRLPEPTRRLILLAAAGPDCLPIGCLVQAAQRAGVDIAALAPAEDGGLVQVAGDRVTFRDPLVRGIVYEAAPLADRREAQLRIAAGAAATGDLRRAAAAMARAAELTGEPAQAAHRLITAAQYAWRSGSPDLARGLLQRVRRVEPDGDPSGDPTGDRAGDPDRDPSGDPDGERRLLAGEIELRTGAATAALDSLLAAGAALVGHRRDLAIRALIRATEATRFSGEHARCGEIAAQTAALRRPAEPTDERQMLDYLAGYTAIFTGGYRRAVEPLRRAVALAEQLDDVVALVLAAGASLLLADDASARRLASRAIAAARGTGYTSALPLAMEVLAEAELGLGRYEAAAASCQEGWLAARTTGQANYAADHRALLAVLAAIRGDHDACRLLLRELVIPPDAGALSRPTALSHWALAVMDLASGRPADAAARLGAIGEPATGHGQVVIQVLAAPWLVEAAARAGRDRQRALAVLDLFDRWAHSTQAPLPRALAARCHALLAPRDSGAAVAHFQEALRLHHTGDTDFERARTELLFGQELRRQRRPREAREHLHRALEVFGHLSLESWAGLAASELRAAGARVGAGRAMPDRLTAQQRQIAELVSLGATNREIAAELFISPRTVDHHLRNIYHRLGIRSRVELARQLR